MPAWQTGCLDFVVTQPGQGAFVAKLADNDPRFKAAEDGRTSPAEIILRRAVTTAFLRVATEFPGMRFHFVLPIPTGLSTASVTRSYFSRQCSLLPGC